MYNECTMYSLRIYLMELSCQSLVLQEVILFSNPSVTNRVSSFAVSKSRKYSNQLQSSILFNGAEQYCIRLGVGKITIITIAALALFSEHSNFNV